MAAALHYPGLLVGANVLLERARDLANEGDFSAAAEAYARLEPQLRAVAAAVPASEAHKWAEFLRGLQQERDLVAWHQSECAELKSWASNNEEACTPARDSTGSMWRGGAAAFNVDTHSFEVVELGRRQQQQRGGGSSCQGSEGRDPDVWLPPPDAPGPTPPSLPHHHGGAPYSRERSRREREDAYERQRRESLASTPTGSSAKKSPFSEVKPRVNTGAKRMSGVAALHQQLDPVMDMDLYSSCDQELIQQLKRDMMAPVSRVTFADIAGLKPAKQVLEEHLSCTLLMSHLYEKIPLLRPRKGVLLFGPPGTGKTMLAKAVAAAGSCEGGERTHFINVSASTLASKYRGESEKLVRFLFEIARAHQPCVIFIDEIDALCSSRGSQNEHEASRRMKTELLTQIDGMHSDSGSGSVVPRVMVLAATNFPWDIDEALRRRLEKRIYIPLPQLEDRVTLLGLCLRGMKAAPDVDLHDIARLTEGFSGDDIANLVRSAADNVMRRIRRGRSADSMPAAERATMRTELEQALTVHGIGATDFREALARSNPSCSAADVERHLKFAQEFGCT